MSELVVVNGCSPIARAVVKSILQKSAGKYASVALADARPYRQSVYGWQRDLAQNNVTVNKRLTRNVGSLKQALQGAEDVVYFTHDYFTMASDKNSHIQKVAQIAKQQGVKNLVGVLPFEHDLAWAEENQPNFYNQAQDASAAALQANPNATFLRTNLAFGPESHFIHFLTQCLLKRYVPYDNLAADGQFSGYAPVHTDDIANAVNFALNDTQRGIYNLNGSANFKLGELRDQLALAAGSNGKMSSPLFPMTYFWDFLVGTTSDINMSRMVEFYEQNPQIADEFNANPWTQTAPEIGFKAHYSENSINSSDYASPQMHSYKRATTN